MRTALTLTEDQIARMLRYAKGQIDSIEISRIDWIKDRDNFHNIYDTDLAQRTTQSAIYNTSNETLSMITGGIDYITARRIEAIFKVDPWIGVLPRTKAGETPQFAEQLARHLNWKLGPEQIDFEAHAEEELKLVGIRGECVSKIAHISDTEDYERIASILYEKATNKPVLDQDGDFIFQENGVQEGQGNDGQNQVQYAFPTGHPEIILGTSDENGNLDPSSTQRYEWREQIVSDTQIRYIGAKTIPLHYKEFYCPLEVKSIQDSNFVAQVTSMRLSQLLEQLNVDLDDDKEPDGDEDDDKQETKVKDLPDTLQRLINVVKAEDGKSKSESDKPIRVQGESDLPQNGDEDPQFRYCEAYMRFDARDDGRAITIFFTFALDHDIPIFWDYLSNVTPDGKYPFNAIVQDKVPHRWYGTSWYKKYQGEQSLIDRILNQIVARNNLASNPIKFRRKEAVVQWQDDQPFEIGPDKVFDLNDQYTASDALQIVEIPDLDEKTSEMLNMIIASWRTRSGISTATDSELANVPQQKTATGVTAIVNSGNTLFTPLVLDVSRGLEAELRMLVKYQYTNQEAEKFTYQQNNQELVDILTPEMVKGLDLHVELKLTNLSASQRLEQTAAAGQVLTEFLNMPLMFQPVVKPIYVQRLSALEIDNGEQILDDLIQQGMQAAQQQSSPQQKLTEQIAFKDLSAFPEAQVRWLQAVGWLTQDEGNSHLQRANNERQANAGGQATPPVSANRGNPSPQSSSSGSAGDSGQGTNPAS